MRRLGMIFLISSLSTSAYAANYGFYGGFSIGYGDLSMDTQLNIDTFDRNTSILLIDNYVYSRNLQYQIRVGYANGYPYHTYVPRWYERFHWAIEAFFEPQTQTVVSNALTGANVEYHLKHDYGAIIKPGLQTSLNTTLQLHLGVVRATFNKVTTDPGFIEYAQTGHHGKSDTGVRVGLGFEGRLNRNISIELSATRTYFSNKHTDRYLLPNIVDEYGNIYTQEILTFKPRMDQILLNFNYYLVR